MIDTESDPKRRDCLGEGGGGYSSGKDYVCPRHGAVRLLTERRCLLLLSIL